MPAIFLKGSDEMSDYERYADYNDIEEDRPKSKSPVLLILKIITALVCLSVVGVLAFRMIIFSSYPDSVKNIYFNDPLTAYYESTDGNIGAKTQNLRFPYDDEDLGNFFCDHLIVIDEINQLQITVRYNTGSLKRIAEENGVSELNADDPTIFSYRLCDNYGRVYLTDGSSVFDEQVMYRYHKLVFDGVNFAPDAEGKFPEWIRLEITVTGDADSKVYMVPVYENNETYDDFSEYKLSSKEKP